MKVTPFAVAGRWRATTRPASCTRAPSRIVFRAPLGTIVSGRSGRISSSENAFGTFWKTKIASQCHVGEKAK